MSSDPAAPNGPADEPAAKETTTAPAAPSDPDDRDDPEAKRYRLRLREVEGERDALAARVSAGQRRDVERLAAASLAQPGDLLALGGVTVEALLGEDGEVDETKVKAAVEALLTTRPGLHRDARGPGWPETGGGRRGTSGGGRTTWADVLGR